MLEHLNEEVRNFLEEGASLGITEPQVVCENMQGGKRVKFNNREVLDFTRLDYMALGSEEKIKALMINNIRQYDISCPASQIIMKLDLINELEHQLAQWHGLKKTMIFTNGYSTNVNMMQSLGLRMRSPHLNAFVRTSNLGKTTRDIPTVFVVDADSHYSLVHGIKIARKFAPAHCFSYGYRASDKNSLEKALQTAQKRFGEDCIKIIVSDTLTSSVGHILDIGMLYEKAELHDALLYLDDAHAVGVYGPDGAGVARALLPENFDPRRVMIMGTLTKAISQLGGYVSFGCEGLHALAKVGCPQHIFSAPILPWMAKTITQTISLLSGDWGKKAIDDVSKKAAYMREKLEARGFDCMGSNSHIIPVFIGEMATCLDIRRKLIEMGFNVAAFHFPSVPKNKSVLRLSICRDFTYAELDSLVEALSEVCAGYSGFQKKSAEVSG